MIDDFHLRRNLALEAVRITEQAALAASLWVGRGDERQADDAAVNAMRDALNRLEIDGTVVIGEGERDQAPRLFLGEKVGMGGTKIDIALDPLEGTTITSKGGMNALTVIALADKGGFLQAPDVYMDKIAISSDCPSGTVDLDESPQKNIAELARAKKKDVSELLICILDRPRHKEVIVKCREAGARVMLIQDGDISAVIAAASPELEIDLYLGQGGAPEGVLAAAALACTKGFMQGRLVFRSEEERQAAYQAGITDLTYKYTLEELACGNVMFAATGVTDGSYLRGVKRFSGRATTHSVVMRAQSGTVRYIEAYHDLNRP